MKIMKCNQLGGPENCSHEFKANTFEEMAELSKKHGMEMFQKQDQEHMQAGQKMMGLMQDPAKMQEWMDSKKKEFEELSEE